MVAFDGIAQNPLLLTWKCRLNPTRIQHRALSAITEQQRHLYNGALEERIEAYRKTGRTITEVEQSRSLTVIRADDPSFAAVQRRIQRATLKRLDRSYKAFFRRAKAGHGASSGFPKFKGREHFDGFSFDAFLQISFDGKRLRFAGMPGGLRVNVDRSLPLVPDKKTGEIVTDIRNIWFKREGRRWYCGFQVATMPRADRKGCGEHPIGVDWGTSVLAALSSGEVIPNPRHGEALQKDLARAQRAVARKKLGSKSRLKARRHKNAVERRIANRRRNTMDKVSARLVKHFGIVAVEKIEASKLMNAERVGETLPTFVKTRRNREALDAAPFMLRQMLAYKAQRECADLIEIDPKMVLRDGQAAQPTQRCSMCGRLHFKELKDAEHICTTPGPFQNLRLPRKVNAARVIIQLALGDHGVSPSGGDRGGPIPGGAEQSANASAGSRRLGNTGAEKSVAGRRGQRPLLTHARDPRDPRLRPDLSS